MLPQTNSKIGRIPVRIKREKQYRRNNGLISKRIRKQTVILHSEKDNETLTMKTSK